MIRIVLFSAILFGLLLFRFPAPGYPEAPGLRYLWQYDLETGSASAPPAELGSGSESPFNLVRLPPRDRESGPRLVGPGVAPVELERGALVWAPFLGGGYFVYSRIGREIRFFDRGGEELWKKEFFSYPVSDPQGRTILMLTGDASRVDFIDANGASVGLGRVHGAFLSDFAFAARTPRAVLAFLDRRLYVVDDRGRLRLSLVEEAEDRPYFFKSAAISPDGSLVAVHALDGTNDVLRVYAARDPVAAEEFYAEEGEVSGGLRALPDSLRRAVRAELQAEFALEQSFPHLLHMALGPRGLLLTAPEYARYFDLDDSDYHWTRNTPPARLPRPVVGEPEAGSAEDGEEPPPRRRASPVYRPVYADERFFAYGEANYLRVLNARGELTAEAALDLRSDAVWRLAPGRASDVFAVESDALVAMQRFEAASSDD